MLPAVDGHGRGAGRAAGRWPGLVVRGGGGLRGRHGGRVRRDLRRDLRRPAPGGRDPPANGGWSRASTATTSRSSSTSRADRDGPLPGIVHTHGGGMVICAAADPQYVPLARRTGRDRALRRRGGVSQRGRQALATTRFRPGLNDCATGTRWTYANRTALGVLAPRRLRRLPAVATSASPWRSRRSGKAGSTRSRASTPACPYIAGTYDPGAPGARVMARETAATSSSPRMCQALVKVYDPTGEHTPRSARLAVPGERGRACRAPAAHGVRQRTRPSAGRGGADLRRAVSWPPACPTASRTVNGTYHGGDTDTPALLPHVYRATIRDIQGFRGVLGLACPGD